MKVFTRPLIVVGLLALLSGGVFAQPADVGVTTVNVTTTQNSTVPDGWQSPISYTFMNFGGALTTTDSVYTGIIINNDTGWATKVYFSSGFTAGGSSTFPDQLVDGSGNPIGTLTYTFSGPVGTTFHICAFAKIITQLDNDTTNDLECHTVITIANDISLDLALFDFKLLDPDLSTIDNFDTRNETQTPPAMEELEVKIANHTELDLSGYQLSFKIWLGNDDHTVTYVPEVFAAGDTLTWTIDDMDDIPATPAKDGDYKVYIAYNTMNDNQSNDTAFFSFKLIDTFWPIGINEALATDVNVFYSNHAVSISGIQSPLEVTITDVTGKVIAREKMEQSGLIHLNAASGIYMVNMTDPQTGAMATKKVSVQ